MQYILFLSQFWKLGTISYPFDMHYCTYFHQPTDGMLSPTLYLKNLQGISAFIHKVLYTYYIHAHLAVFYSCRRFQIALAGITTLTNILTQDDNPDSSAIAIFLMPLQHFVIPTEFIKIIRQTQSKK